MRFLVRRILHSLLLLFGTSLLSFVIMARAPGDFFDALRFDPRVSTATVEGMRRDHGLNRSLPAAYCSWVGSAARGDWGFSFAYNAPAGPILWARALNTLLLAGTATLLAWMVAMPLGIWAAVRPRTWIDWLTRGMVSILLATPELVLGLLLLLLAVRTGWLPAGGMLSFAQHDAPLAMRAADVSKHLLLPCLCLAAGLAPLVLTHARAAMTEALAAPASLAARAYGIPFGRLVLWHALPVAANPLLSLMGLSLGMLLSSSLLIETIFGWPGLGQLVVEGVLQRDFFLVLDSAVLAAAMLLLGNLAADLMLYASDPRIRTEE